MFFEKISESLISSFLVSDVRESLRSLTKNERCEQIDQVAHQKWAMWANHSGGSLKMSNHERFANIAQSKWAGLGTCSFQKNAIFLRSFPFFIKERNDFCVLSRSL